MTSANEQICIKTHILLILSIKSTDHFTRHNEKCDHLDYLKTSASDTECTGVVYTGPLNDVELDNINDVYAFEPEPAKKREV